MPFGLPAEREPDGDRYLGHHFWVGIAMMIIGWMQWAPHGTPVAGTTLIWIGLIVLLDDLVSHYFGVWTPLDAIFKWAVAKGRRDE